MLPRQLAAVATELEIERVADDRANLEPDDAVLLIVEDDPHYARVLCDLSHDKGFKVLVAMGGAEALALAREFHPTAVSLDVFLPDMLGWTVLNHLKQDPATRHIPVQMLTLDEDRHHGLTRGAFAFVTKPTTPEGLESALDRIKEYASAAPQAPAGRRRQSGRAAQYSRTAGPRRHRYLDRGHRREALASVVRIRASTASCSTCACPICRASKSWNGLRDTPSLSDLPVVVFTGKELSPEEDARLHTLARSVVVKGVESPERLLDETALFLHRVVANLPPEKQKMLDRLHRSDDALVGKKVLVVDDDVRNIFALSSVLERRGMTVLTAGTGREAIATLEINSGSRNRADGHHDAGNGWIRNHAGDPAESFVPASADHCADGESDERRPREVSRGRRLRVSGETGQHRATALGTSMWLHR